MKLNKILYWVIILMTSVGFEYCMGVGEDQNADGNKVPPSGHVPDAEGKIGGNQVRTDSPGPGNTPKDTRELKGTTVIELGCIFNEREDLGIQPFSKIKKADESCDIILKNETDTFMYACDGTSDPPNCPVEVKVEEGVVRLDTLFTQATITNQSVKYTGAPSIFHVVTGKAHKEFIASCECTRTDGKKDTMKLTSSFKQIGILGVIGFTLLMLIK